jgi:hypothetical protein
MARVANARRQIIDRRPGPGYGCRERRFLAASRCNLEALLGLPPDPPVETQMTTFDDREQAFEKKFALDQDLKFRAEAKRNKLLAEWAAAKLGITGEALEAYTKSVLRADLEEKGDEDVFAKIRKDFDEKGLSVPDAEIRAAMGEFLAKAVAEIEASSKKP